MTIHREGFKSISIAAVAFIVINLVTFNWMSATMPVLTGIVFFATLFLFLFIVSFFRVPRRTMVVDAGVITSPCDGKVVVIEEVTDTEYFNDRRLQVSVFMSPANVHMNTNPLTGEVLYSKYHPGKYLVAWHPKSSTENERHSVVLQNEKVTILVKQIAGALARRIVNYLQPGQQVQQGGELGFIKFGSRVDLLLPPDAKVQVQLNQTVQAGVSIIATC